MLLQPGSLVKYLGDHRTWARIHRELRKTMTGCPSHKNPTIGGLHWGPLIVGTSHMKTQIGVNNNMVVFFQEGKWTIKRVEDDLVLKEEEP